MGLFRHRGFDRLQKGLDWHWLGDCSLFFYVQMGVVTAARRALISGTSGSFWSGGAFTA